MMTNTTPAHTTQPSTCMTLDLFGLLDACETLTDELMVCSDTSRQLALYVQLADCLEAMEYELEKPLSPQLIERLTAEKLAEVQPQQIAGDSELLRQYCYALIRVLLSQRQAPEVNETLKALLFELINLLVDDLLMPRFERQKGS